MALASTHRALDRGHGGSRYTDLESRLLPPEDTDAAGDCQVEPSVCSSSRGRSGCWCGDDTFDYNSERFLIASLDIPASSEVVEASRNGRASDCC